METIDTITAHHVGNVTVRVTKVWDECPDLSWLATFADDPGWDTNVYTYHRRDGVMRIPRSDLWRDRKGRIVAEPERSIFRHEYGYITVPDNGQGLKCAFADAERLESLDRGNWYFFGIVATVTVGGKEIGSSSVWGIESDSDEKFVRDMARDIAHEAVKETRAWFKRIAA